MNRNIAGRDGRMLVDLFGRSKLRRTVRAIEAIHSQSEVSTWKAIGNR